MFDLKIVSLFLFVANIDCQGLFSGRQNPLDRLPGIGACDRIASRGVGNCMENFLPRNVLSSFTGGPRGGANGDICCSYSKYRACISGLHAGLKIAMERERCPKSYSTKIIKSMGDSFVGSSLRQTCGNGGGASKCPKTSGTKPKKNQKPPKRTQNTGEDDSLGLGGLGGGGLGGLGGGGFNPVGDIFGGGRGGGGGNRRGEGSDPLSPVRDVFNRGRETFQQGASSIIGGVQNAFAGLGDFGGRRNN